MKKVISILIAFLLMIGLAACSGGRGSETPESDPAASDDPRAAAEEDETSGSSGTDTTATEPAEAGAVREHKNVLVVFFSATGTTKGVAEKIAAIEDADIYEIKAKQEYTSDDLNWNDRDSRSTKEQNDKSARPEIGSERISLEGYEKIYIGFPIWWGEEPRIMDTFVESYDFGGVTVIPFCTSSSSGIGRSGQNLADNANSGNWLDGERFGSSVSESELRSWIDSMK